MTTFLSLTIVLILWIILSFLVLLRRMFASTKPTWYEEIALLPLTVYVKLCGYPRKH